MHLSLTTPLVQPLYQPLHPGRPMEAIAMPENDQEDCDILSLMPEPSPLTDQLLVQLIALVEAEGLSNAEIGRRCQPTMSGQRVGQVLSGKASTVGVFERMFRALGAELVFEVKFSQK